MAWSYGAEHDRKGWMLPFLALGIVIINRFLPIRMVGDGPHMVEYVSAVVIDKGATGTDIVIVDFRFSVVYTINHSGSTVAVRL